MKKVLGIFVLVLTALILFSCKGNGGGNSGSSGSGSTGGTTAPATVATFAANFNINYAIEVNTNTDTAAFRATLSGIDLLNENSPCSFSGSFDNGTLSFTGGSTITITNGSFNLNTGDGNHTFTKTSSTANTATYSCTIPGSYVVAFKNNNTYTMTGTGYLAGESDSGVYSITSGDFNNGTIVIDGDTCTITNGSFGNTIPVEDANGTTQNLTVTFVKQ